MTRLEQLRQKRTLVSISRSKLVDNPMQGYVIAHSDELLVAQLVYDFHLDGLQVMRIKDITNIKEGQTNAFQRELIKGEGLEQHIPFDTALDASEWTAILSDLSQIHPVVILECERAKAGMPRFIIGHVTRVGKKSVDIVGFDGVARWNKKATTIKLKDLTSCKAGSNYAAVYRRHFERTAAAGHSASEV